RKPSLLFRALLAVVVLVPLVVILLLKLFHLPPEVTTGLALLAAAPGAPLTAKRSQMAGARFRYSASFQLTLALLAVFITPLTLAIFASQFELLAEKVRLLEVAKQVTIVQFLPVSLGLLIQKFGSKFAEALGQPLVLIANGLFFLLVILLCIFGFPFMLKVWGLPMVAIAIMVVASLGIGHWLGGPEDDKRSILAISCIARNVGLALFIAVLNDVEYLVVPTLLAYMILGSFIAVPYSIWNKRKFAQLPS
ncbi:MAG: sodium dependent transporter, partial [Microcystaceae cyanobacterium]